MAFKVTDIISASSIRVLPRWSWEDYAGDIINIKGFANIISSNTGEFIKKKLETLLLNKEVELKNPSNPVRNNGNDEITVSVYLNGVDISIYFPELKSVA